MVLSEGMSVASILNQVRLAGGEGEGEEEEGGGQPRISGAWASNG